MPTQTPQEIIAGLYAAVFNRAPDKAGLDFWAGKATDGDANEVYQDIMDPEGAAEGFVDHPVFVADYNDLTNAEFAAKIYVNALGQAGDQAGINFWTERLDLGPDNGGLSRGDMVVEFVRDTLTGDFTVENFGGVLTSEELLAAQERQDYLENKVNVSLHWVNELGDKTNVTDNNDPTSDPAYIASQKVLEKVTQDADTVGHMNAIIDEANTTADSSQFIVDHVNGHIIETGEPSYTLTADADTVNEGADATFTLETTNVADGTAIAYTIGDGVDANDIVGGSLQGIATIIDNKAIISISLEADLTTERLETLTVSLDGKLIEASTNVIDTSVDPQQTATEGEDTLVGTDNDGDKFFATQDTLGLGDSFDGKDGIDDVLNISISGTAGVTLTGFETNNIETIAVKSLSGAASVLDMSDVAGATKLESNETEGASLAFRDIQDTDATISIVDTDEDHIIDYDIQTLTGTDTIKLDLQEIRPETGAAVVNIDFLQDGNTDAAIETLAINSTTVANNVNSIVVGNLLTGMTIEGDASLSIATPLDSNIATLNAGEHTGAALNLDMTASAVDVVYTGSQGVDTITFEGTANNNTISLGAGDDHLEMGAGNDTVSGGAGNDMFHFDTDELTIADTVSGGEGNDRIIIEGQDEIQRTETENVSGVETIELQDAGSLLVVTDNLVSGGGETLTQSFTVDTTSQTGGHTIDMTDVTDTSGFKYQGGSANDTLLISDGQLNSTAELSFGGGIDTMKVVNGATITADDFNKISGLEVIILVSDSTQPQTWSLEGVPAGLTIIADPTIPQGSVLNLSNGAAASISFANNANITINDPTGIAVVSSLLEFTENADDLVGTAGDDVFHASTLDQVQGADAANGLGHVAGDELVLDFAVVNAANGTLAQLGNPGITNIETVTFNTQNSVRLTDDGAFETYNMGTNNDVFNASVLGGNATVNMNAGDDTFNDNSVVADFTVSGQAGSDTFNIDATVLNTNDTLDGGADADTMNLDATVTLANDVKFTNVSNIETLNVAGNLAGSSEFQDAAFTQINGSAGNDGLAFTSETALTIDQSIFDSADTDFGANGGVTNAFNLNIDAGAGDDIVAGGSGNDTIVDGTGIDLIIGAAGADTINLSADNNNDVIAYTRAGDGANTNAPVDGFDIVTGFNNDNAVGDLISIEGSLLAAITNSSTIEMVIPANNEASLDAGLTDLAVYTNTSLSNAALTDLSDSGNLLTFLNNSLDTAAAGDATIFSVQGTSNTGVYFYQENGGDNIIDQSEIRMLSSVEGSLLEANDFTSALLQPPQTLTAATANVNEGANAIFNLATAGVADGTVLNYALTGVDAADITDANVDGDNNALTGTVTVNGDVGTVTLAVAADATTEAVPETMTVSVDVNGTAVTADMIVNDTSQTPLENIVNFNFGNTSVNLAGDNAVDEVFFMDAVAALGTGDNTQVIATNFDVANDILRIDMADAQAGVTTLDQLNGVNNTTVQTGGGNTLINLGPDANGDIVTITMPGIADQTTVNVEIV